MNSAASIQPIILLTFGNAVNCEQFLHIIKNFNQTTLTGHLLLQSAHLMLIGHLAHQSAHE
jgi:hypothetical protein